ncbi:MAG: hypothetical protein K8I03_04400 [Ignavibacteria bacterium]|nr:hypothetical protein [Ignavibacteria bacterium]
MRDSLYSLSSKEKTFREYSSFPPVLRDLSIVVDSGIKEGDIEKVILDAKTENLLKKLRLYDIYKPENQGVKLSYTYTMEFRSDDRTLTNDEINKIQERIVSDLNKKLNAELRK